MRVKGALEELTGHEVQVSEDRFFVQSRQPAQVLEQAVQKTVVLPGARRLIGKKRHPPDQT